MSGPKTYSFPVSSAEEGAEILAKMSGLRSGVQVRVCGNNIVFDVTNEAWLDGANYASLGRKVKKAQQSYQKDEEVKRLLRDGKAEEQRKTDSLRKNLDKDYETQKRKLMEAKNGCKLMRAELAASKTTPFGTFHMQDEMAKLDAQMQKLDARLQEIERERTACATRCDEYKTQVNDCAELSDLSRVKINAPQMSLVDTYEEKNAQTAVQAAKAKKAQFNAFMQYLTQTYSFMQERHLEEYMPRIKAKVATLDPCSPQAVEILEREIEEIAREQAFLAEQAAARQDSREIQEKIAAQGAALKEMSRLLARFVVDTRARAEKGIEYEKLNGEMLSECDDLLQGIQGLEFVNATHRREIESLKMRAERCRTSLQSPAAHAELTGTLTRLRALKTVCETENETYRRFAAEHERYKGLYMRLRGMLSAEDSQLIDESGYLQTPTDILFENSTDAETQIAELKRRNDELEKTLNKFMQESFCHGTSALLREGQWGNEFKKERDKDGALHLTYVRQADKGAIFDIGCTADGQISIVPRGVVLSNGKKTLSREQLETVHESCGWAEDISTAFGQIGLGGGSYTEMPQEKRLALYDEREYYRIQTDEESVRFLRLSGYTDEEIKAFGYLQDAEERDDTATATRRTGKAAARTIDPRK
ncbi:MAG: hypothetical protein J6U60_01245 [Clostridia bacterium]|nr:hypothetical protein [Clostridia bacterium]